MSSRTCTLSTHAHAHTHRETNAHTDKQHKRTDFWNHAMTQVVDRRTGQVAAKLYQGGNCKTETCYVNQGFWMQPNADFVPIYSEKEFLILKQYVVATLLEKVVLL